MLPYRQFKSWHMHNESLTQAEAEAKWTEDPGNPDIKRDIEDGRTVPVLYVVYLLSCMYCICVMHV